MAFVCHIFPLQSQWLTAKRCKETNSCSEDGDPICHSDMMTLLCENNHNKIIVAGPDRADKTSLVFQAAVTAASLGSKVVYICTHPISRLPAPVHGMRCPEPSIMRNVDFLYFEECRELVSFLANVHTKKKVPDLIVVEDILSYASQLNENNLEMGLAKLCALLSNTSSWISNNNETGKCSILMTAPSRISSLDFVFTQFDFKMAQYKGPSSDDSISHLSYQWKSGKIDISFNKVHNCLMIQDVFAVH